MAEHGARRRPHASMPHWLLRILYPELDRCAPAERAAALRTAREEPLDLVEGIGIGIALALTVLVTSYDGHGFTATDKVSAALLNFAVALPLLAVLAGPFHVRRVRRGLRSQHGRTPS